MRDRKDLINLIQKAEQIVSRHNGIHHLHGDIAGIKGWLWFFDEGLPESVDWDNIDLLIKKCRITDKTGFYPLDK